MTKPILKSIALPAIASLIWISGSRATISFSEPIALIATGVFLIGIANIGKKRFKKKS